MLNKWPNGLLNYFYRMIIYLLGLTLGMGVALSAQADNRLGGISTRSFVQTDSTNYMIAGVLITGSSKRIIVRASSIDGVLNPLLEVQSFPDGNLLYSNDNWATDPSATELQQTGWTPAGSSDSAMIITLSPGLYTMQVSPVDKPGVGLIEVYELSSTESPKLGGISTRSFVQTDSMNYMIAGLFISGSAKQVVVRASGVVDGMLDPILEVQSYPDGNLLYSNDNWATDPSAVELQQLGWSPARSLDAAMIVTLQPGLYTMQVSPKLNPGIGLIEVYELAESVVGELPIVEPPTNCPTSEPTNCPNLDNIPAPPEDADIYLGMGLDSNRDWFKQSVCINGTPKQITASIAKFSTSLVSDYTSLLERTEIGGGADVSIKGLFNIHADAQYEKVVTQRDYGQAFVLEYDVKLGTQSYNLDVMSPLNYTGLSAVDGGYCYFRQICGDQYIHQVEHGGTVHVEMDFQFTKSSHKQEFNATFKGGLDKKFKICSECGVEKIIPFSVELEASINRLSTTVRKNTSLHITASQTGGYAEDLINVIGTNTLSCSLNKITKCKKVLDDVVGYIKDKFAPSIRELPAVYGYKMFPYEQIIGVPDLLSDVTPEIEQARLDLATEYKQRLEDLDKVRNLLFYNLPPEREQRMEYLQAALEQEIEMLSQAGKGCFSDLGNCLAEKCDIFNSLASYEQKELVPGYDPRDGLILDWTFDDCTATDSSWNGRNGSFVKGGPECQDGKIGKAMYFEKGKSIEIPLDVTLPSVAVAFWFNVPKPKTYYPHMIYITGQGYGLSVGIKGAIPNIPRKVGQVTIHFGGSASISGKSLDIAPVNIWNFLVVNANFTTNKFEFWLNGILQNIDDIPPSLVLPAFEKLKLGKSSCPASTCGGNHLTYLTGSLDEFLFYGRALSDSEIQELYEKR